MSPHSRFFHTRPPRILPYLAALICCALSLTAIARGIDAEPFEVAVTTEAAIQVQAQAQAQAQTKAQAIFRVPAAVQDRGILNADVLALSDEFKAVLDARIAPINNPEKRAEALHELLFAPENYFIGYVGKYTFTAAETLNYGGGNCMSLANLLVAAARHVGLRAYFQEAQVEDWEDHADDGYYVLAGHVNVLIKLGGRTRMTVEFLAPFIGRPAHTRIMSDKEALAQYYNNLAMDQLHAGHLAAAQDYLDKALETDDSNPMIWSNMGVIAKRLGDLNAAEAHYLTALKRDNNYPSAAKNLSVLYMEKGHPEKAEKYARIVEKHNRRNPYYLGKIADRAMEREQYSDAIDLLRDAIKIKDDEDRFHFELAQAYYLSGDMKRAARAMKKAKELAGNPADRQRYSSKLKLLNRLYEQS